MTCTVFFDSRRSGSVACAAVVGLALPVLLVFQRAGEGW